MFLHPESLLDLAHLEQAERDRHLNQHLHLAALRPLRDRREVGFRPRVARFLRALADRLQPAPEIPTPSADPLATSPWATIDPWPALDTWATPRSAHVQRLREHARPHAMVIARRHDVRRVDAA